MRLDRTTMEAIGLWRGNEEGGDFGMGGGVETEDVECTGAESMIFLGFGEQPETDSRFSQNIKVAPDEVGVEFLFSIEETKNLLLVKIDIDHD